MRGKQTIFDGRASVRTTLYMATLSAVRDNQTIKTFYTRFVQAGKVKKVALVASMRKLFSMIKKGEGWDNSTIIWPVNFGVIKTLVSRMAVPHQELHAGAFFTGKEKGLAFPGRMTRRHSGEAGQSGDASELVVIVLAPLRRGYFFRHQLSRFCR